tara:strand:+ start:6655 stop:8061 length:1407 start_codon:yes stop_codon:yes gene_type:complete
MRLSNKIKFLYGVGFVSVGIKDVLYTLFVFFFYNQVLGLDPFYTGLATFVSLFFDAFSDPFVGALSDNFRSKKWGRRHPFMLMSAIPLGVSIWLLFNPLANMSDFQLFCWLTFFSIVIRFFLTMYIVPAMSLGAELTKDYNERTILTSFRLSFTTALQPIIFFMGIYFFFTDSVGLDTALRNPDAYSPFSLYCGVIVTLSILISSIGTESSIPSLPQNSKNESIKSVIKIIKKALKMKSFRSIVFFTAMVYVAFGVGNTITTYKLTYIFKFNEIEMLSIILAGAIGGLFSLYIGPKFGKLFDKKKAAIVCTILFSVGMTSPYTLKLVDLMPSNENPAVIFSVFFLYLFAFTFLWSGMSLSSSMMADVVDEYEVSSNKRNEGIFFSILSFAYKCTVGVGYLIGGLLLKLISFPTQTSSIEISDKIVQSLTFIGGPLLFLVYISSLIFLIYYPLDKKKYKKIRDILDRKT